MLALLLLPPDAAEGTYSLEAGFLEMLLQSEHRTLDPEEADFFYVPVFTSCFIYPVRWVTQLCRAALYGCPVLLACLVARSGGSPTPVWLPGQVGRCLGTLSVGGGLGARGCEPLASLCVPGRCVCSLGLRL